MADMRQSGRVLRFDGTRGYGFVSPDSGGEDVFLHANDLEFDKQLLAPGVRVEFEAEKGDRGLKASYVTLVGGDEPGAPAVRALASSESGPLDDVMSDVLAVDEFRREVTEAILEVAPSVTGAQICAIRARLEQSAVAHGWVES